MANAQNKSPIEPVLVGRFPIQEGEFDGQEMLPIGARELRALAWFWQDILETAGFAIGTPILLAATLDQAAQLYPLELAAADLNLVVCSAEPTFFDAGRVESILRRFAPAAVVGVGMATIEGLRAAGHDPAGLLKDRIVWAWPDAYDVVRAMSDVTALRLAEIGPMLAVECLAARGLHFDNREWSIEQGDQGWSVSGRLPRALPFVELQVSAMPGHIDPSLCTCGLSHPRITISPVRAD